VKSAKTSLVKVEALWVAVCTEAAQLGCTAATALIAAVAGGSYEVYVTHNPGVLERIAVFCDGGGGVVGGVARRVQERAADNGKAARGLGGTLLVWVYILHCPPPSARIWNCTCCACVIQSSAYLTVIIIIVDMYIHTRYTLWRVLIHPPCMTTQLN
jgi:hypothetical protein